MSNKICFVQYTEYSRTPRIRRNAEALQQLGYIIDCYVLGEVDATEVDNINGVNIIYSNVKQYRGYSLIRYIISYINNIYFFVLISSLKYRYLISTDGHF